MNTIVRFVLSFIGGFIFMGWMAALSLLDITTVGSSFVTISGLVLGVLGWIGCSVGIYCFENSIK